MTVTVATQDNFESLINDNELVLIDFWAPWCGPCRNFAPTFEAASEKHSDALFAKINTDEQQALASAFQIRSIPTLMVFRQKIILYAQPGALPASALDALVEKTKSLDMDKVRRDIVSKTEIVAPSIVERAGRAQIADVVSRDIEISLLSKERTDIIPRYARCFWTFDTERPAP